MRLLMTTLIGLLAYAQQATALDCGTYNYPFCSNSSSQYSGGFNPATGHGGFGGGNCTASKTPVIFIHGNGDEAINWDAPPHIGPAGYTLPPQSVYDTFKSKGYNDCELFGVSYLTSAEKGLPAQNYHSYTQQIILSDFITAVKKLHR